MYWLIVNGLMTAANTVVAVRENNSTSWLLWTMSLALTLFCVARVVLS